MTRQICKYIDGKWEWMTPGESPPTVKVHVIQDSMNPTLHPCDGKVYESKSAFRAVTKAFDCIEVGNDKLPRRKSEEQVRAETRSGVSQALREALEKCRR